LVPDGAKHFQTLNLEAPVTLWHDFRQGAGQNLPIIINADTNIFNPSEEIITRAAQVESVLPWTTHKESHFPRP